MNADNNSTYHIRDLDTLHVISDPLRTQIYDLCAEQPRTVREIAGRLGVPPTRLYYHINLLEKRGLLVVDETRTVGNLIEKRYRSIASRLEIDTGLFTIETRQGKENFFTLVRSLLESTRDELLRTLEARSATQKPEAEREEREIVLYHLATHIPKERAAEFSQRLKTLVGDFEGTDQPGEQSYGLTVAYYPVLYFPDASAPDALDQPAA